MFVGGKVLRLIPDQPGFGGSKTAQSTFILNLNTRIANNMWVYQGKWVKTPALEPYGQAPFVFQNLVRSFSIHNYLKYDLTNAAMGSESFILTHDRSADFTNYINGQYVAFGNPPLRIAPIRKSLTGPNACTPAVFANIKNRCFISWSATNSFIYDGNGIAYNPDDYCYDIGVNGPVTAPTYILSGGLSRIGVVYGDTADGDYTISYTNGSTSVTAVDFNAFGPIFSPGVIKAVTIGGESYPVVSPGSVTTYSATAVDPTIPKATGTIGTKTLTMVGYLFPPDGQWNGLLINIASPSESAIIASYTLGGSDTTVTLATNLAASHTDDAWTLTGEELHLQTAYQGGTVLETGTLTFFNGDISWTGPGPRYAYAYYDPVTGHVSNVSPYVEIVEQDQYGVIVEVRDIMPSVSTDQVRFTKILIFRTQLAGGSVLYPLGTFGYPPTFEELNNVGAAPLFFVDNHPDTDLLINGGLVAPLVNNAKPTPATHQLYFDQRLWLNPVNDPTAINFSADFYQVPFGVAEESFPALNQLRVSSDDGRVRGMKLVGNLAEVMTDRYSYIIVGGPDAASYRLTRLGPQTYGVGDYQMEELPGDIGDNSSALAYISRDARVFLLAPQYGNVALSDPISDVLAGQIVTTDQYYDSRIHYYQGTNVRLLVVTLPGGTCMTYNFDQKTWCETQPWSQNDPTGFFRPEGLCTIFGGTRPTELLTVTAGQTFRWMDVGSNVGPQTAYLATAPMDLLGGEKRRKRVNFVRVYTDADTCTVVFNIDETTVPFTVGAVVEPDPQYSIYATPSSPYDFNCKELVAFPLGALTGGGTTITDGFRFAYTVSLPPADTHRYSIYAIDVGYQVIDDDGETVL